MRKTRYFLAQVLIEIDVGDRPDFDESQATQYFNSTLKLAPTDRAHDVRVYLLASKPGSRSDVVIEQYEYHDFRIDICQNASTVGSMHPTFFAVVWNLQAKNPTGSLVDSDCESIDELKKQAVEHVDKRKARIEKRGTGKT